eukprot:1555820-Amphidinium_carterae.4
MEVVQVSNRTLNPFRPSLTVFAQLSRPGWAGQRLSGPNHGLSRELNRFNSHDEVVIAATSLKREADRVVRGGDAFPQRAGRAPSVEAAREKVIKLASSASGPARPA